MFNPLSSSYSEKQNQTWVQQALEGKREALDQLIRHHQPFIYNVAWKMTHDPADAQDLTQEVLIKILTKLATFQSRSSFRTWLYRIVVNEFLQTRRRKGEQNFTSFDAYGEQLDAIPNPDLTIEEEIAFEELSKEMQIRCMSGMLMCLSREQRLIYILGDTIGIDHNLGAEIFNISRQNFRVKLHRARKDLYNYMNNKCGLINKENPCRCPKKAKALKKMGMLDENKMQFNLTTKSRIMDFVVAEHENAMHSIEDKYTDLFRNHSAREGLDKDFLMEGILKDNDLQKYFNLN